MLKEDAKTFYALLIMKLLINTILKLSFGIILDQ